MSKRRIVVLGSTGSIGTQTLDVVRQHGDQLEVVGLAVHGSLDGLLAQANAAISPERWGDGWRYACGLYVAHNAALYLRTYSESSSTPAQAAASGALVGVVKSAQLGDSSVSYDTDALTRATADWGDLNATQYGQMLAARARLIGMGGSYVL